MIKPSEMQHAANYRAWAIGTPQRNGFHVRKVVWGLVMADAERRQGESVRLATVMVGRARGRGRQSTSQSTSLAATERPGHDIERSRLPNTPSDKISSQDAS